MFLQAIKEQETLSINLIDPYFAADEYQRVSLTLSEYTFNVEKLVVSMYAIARKARLATEADRKRIEACYCVDAPLGGLEERQAMLATKSLIEIHKCIVMNEHVTESNQCIPEDDESKHVPKSDDQETAVNNRLSNQTSLNADQVEDCRIDKGEECSTEPPNDEREDKQPLHTENASEAGHETKLAESKQRIADAKLTLMIQEHLNGLGPAIQSLIERLISKYNIPDVVMINVEERLRNADKGPTAETSLARDNGSDNVGDQKVDTETHDELVTNEDIEPRNVFNVPTTTIHNEVFDALWDKIRPRFHSEVVPRKLNLEQADPHEVHNNVNERQMTDVVNERQMTDVHTLERKTEYTGRNDNSEENDVKSENDNHQSDEEGFSVNFYLLSSEFIRELGTLKCKALSERKDTALAKIHEKLENLKNEMGRVEEVVMKELELAYARKMKKAAKQQKELDGKHAEIKEIERLLEYYTVTGQADKLAELMAKINIQFEN